jgi:hypothetical protein
MHTMLLEVRESNVHAAKVYRQYGLPKSGGARILSRRQPGPRRGYRHEPALMSEELKQDPGFGSSWPCWMRWASARSGCGVNWRWRRSGRTCASACPGRLRPCPLQPSKPPRVIAPEPLVAEAKLPVAAPVAQPTIPAARPAPPRPPVREHRPRKRAVRRPGWMRWTSVPRSNPC